MLSALKRLQDELFLPAEYDRGMKPTLWGLYLPSNFCSEEIEGNGLETKDSEGNKELRLLEEY